MWNYVTGVLRKPMNDIDENYIAMLDAWEVNNSKILTWTINFVEHSIGMQLAKYETTQQV